MPARYVFKLRKGSPRHRPIVKARRHVSSKRTPATITKATEAVGTKTANHGLNPRLLRPSTNAAIPAFKAMPNAKVRASPSHGNSHKPVTAAPNTVPRVVTEKTSPTDRPVRANSAVAIRLTSGKVNPRQTVGTNMTPKQIRDWTNS